MGKKLLIALLLLLTKYGYCQEIESMTDPRDGNVYKTCTIGTQTWMIENLRYKVEGAVTYENKDGNVDKNGYLYDWQLANKVCPTGWRLPVEDDWNKLITHLGGKNIAGGKMKLKAKGIWKDPNRLASNSSNFSAYPSGVFKNGKFQLLNEATYFWSSEAECTSAFSTYLTYLAGFADKITLVKTDRASVRCIKK